MAYLKTESNECGGQYQVLTLVRTSQLGGRDRRRTEAVRRKEGRMY
jgi:hypothetical protein